MVKFGVKLIIKIGGGKDEIFIFDGLKGKGNKG